MNYLFTNAITGMSAVLTSKPADQKHLAVPFSTEPTVIRCDAFALSEGRNTTSPAIIVPSSLSMIKNLKIFDVAKVGKKNDNPARFSSSKENLKIFDDIHLAGRFIKPLIINNMQIPKKNIATFFQKNQTCLQKNLVEKNKGCIFAPELRHAKYQFRRMMSGRIVSAHNIDSFKLLNRSGSRSRVYWYLAKLRFNSFLFNENFYLNSAAHASGSIPPYQAHPLPEASQSGNPFDYLLSKFRRLRVGHKTSGDNSGIEGDISAVSVNQSNVFGDNIQGANVTINQCPPELLNILREFLTSKPTQP